MFSTNVQKNFTGMLSVINEISQKLPKVRINKRYLDGDAYFY